MSTMARAWPMRIGLFLLTNLAVLVVFGVVAQFLPPLVGYPEWFGLSPGVLVFFALLGFGGSFISLAMSKQMALWSTGAQVIRNPTGQTEKWVLDNVHQLSDLAGIGRPDVAIWDSPDPNAFATGMRRNHALVAVSTGLLRSMQPEEVRAVLAHEVAHVANGDMVTMTLLQGVLNTFVYALSRVVGTVVDNAISRDRDGPGIGYFVSTIAAQIVFGILASMIAAWFSRRREFRADAGAAELVGPQPMIGALRRLMKPQTEGTDLPQNLAAFGIHGGAALAQLFSTHPPLEERIAALQPRA